MDNGQQKPRVFRKAFFVGLLLGVAVFIVFSAYVFYQIFTSDSSTAILGVIALLYPGALFAGMGFILGWSITLLFVLPHAQDVTRKRFWQLLSTAAILLVAWFGYSTFLKSPMPRFEGSLAVSPDGGKIAFVYGNSGNFDIYVADVGSWKATRVVDAPLDDFNDASPTHLFFSTDGKSVFFINNQNTDFSKFEARHGVENGYLYKVDLAGGGVNRVGEVMFSEVAPSLTGQSFYALISTPWTYRLVELDREGKSIGDLYENADARADGLSISNDGQTLFYTESRSFFRGRESNREFVIENRFVKLDPNRVKETLEKSEATGGHARLSPSGTRIVLVKVQSGTRIVLVK